jgi:hypothetical protein
MRNRILENLHLPFWLIKDACWAMALKPLGLLMIFPTVSLAVYLVIRTRNEIKDFLIGLKTKGESAAEVPALVAQM